MSRKIDWDKPLSDFDRQYALDRDMHEQVRENEAQFGKEKDQGMTLDDVRSELNEARQRVSELEMAEQRLLNPNVANPTATPGAFPPVDGTAVVAPVDNTQVDDEAPEGAPEPDGDEYDQWTKAELQEEIEERNEDRDDNAKMGATGTKAELIERLRADDKARRMQAQR